MPTFYKPQSQPKSSGTATTTTSSTPSPSIPSSPISHKTVSDCTIYHQKSKLDFVYAPNHNWYYQGQTILYLTTSTPIPPSGAKNKDDKTPVIKKEDSALHNGFLDEIALHFRGGHDMKILSTQVHIARYADDPNIPTNSDSTTKDTNVQEDANDSTSTKPTKRRRTMMLPTQKNKQTVDVKKEDTTTQDESNDEMMDVEMTPPALQDENESANVDTPSDEEVESPRVILQPIPDGKVHCTHIDPLAKVLTKPSSTFTDMEYGMPLTSSNSSSTKNEPSKPQRFEADTQCCRNGIGMTETLRGKSIASNCGELRVQYQIPPSSSSPSTSSSAKSTSTSEDMKDWVQCWMTELENDPFESSYNQAAGESSGESIPELSKSLKQKLMVQCDKRRDDRLHYVAKCLADASRSGDAAANIPTTDKKKGGNSKLSKDARNLYAIKLVIHYSLDVPMDMSSSFHLGGIHFHSSSLPLTTQYGSSTLNSNPHVYTTSGTMGDHQGTRCWIPTFDTAKVKHRCTHEMTIQVTADWKEGLWVCGMGESFGVRGTVLHPIPSSDRSYLESIGDGGMHHHHCDQIQHETMSTLGKASYHFISQTYSKPSISQSGFHELSQLSSPQLATAMWMTSVWTPCPSRSLGFAIGPFKEVYDPEYYSIEQDEEEEDEEEDDDDDVPTINEAAITRGEGIRQLYFAPAFERRFIHSNVKMIGIHSMDIMKRNISSLSSSMRMKMKQIELSVIGSTTGVPNRALSLMRDILSFPSYRTTSYTQIWIPNAIDGGSSCGSLHSCPEISCNTFIGGAILNSKLLPPPGHRLPYYSGGGRVVQFAQAQSAVRGWIMSALPLGGTDEIGDGYIHTLFECLVMSLYERAHGACGEGGGKQSFFFSKRYAISSGLNSPSMDFLPIVNVEDDDIPVEERNNEQLWRNATNGTESFTSSLDEFSIRQLLSKDILEALERTSAVPSPGWPGSRLSATFVSSNSTSSSDVGCGALELVHPIGGMVYRMLKCKSLRRIIEGRAGLSNFIRVLRAAFIAGLLSDRGVSKVELPQEDRKDDNHNTKPKPAFVVCVDDMIKDGGITHDLFVRSLRIISGPREPYLRGSMIDVSSDTNETQFLEPEGFPNSFVRGSSSLYLRVGCHVENTASDQSGAAASGPKGFHLHCIIEPVIPGIAFGGPVTLRVIEKGGQRREYEKAILTNGSRSDWGPIFLHADVVTTARQQTNASGVIEGPSTGGKKGTNKDEKTQSKSDNGIPKTLLGTNTNVGNSAFDENHLHKGGYQALELVRITNTTPLLWIRVDPHGLYDGRLAVVLPDACLAEQLFYDGEAGSQVEALRALAERPLRIQGSVKINNVYDVPINELPVRLLSDCLRGSVAISTEYLPHNPGVRAQAALAIAQWQNNKAPDNILSANPWTGLNLLIQYFNERFYKHGSVMPVKFSRVYLKMEKPQNPSTESDQYQYLDNFTDEIDRKGVIEEAIEIGYEEDEEYRVRSSVITAIASCRAKDGSSPPLVLKFLERILQCRDETSLNLVSLEEEKLIRQKVNRKKTDSGSNNNGQHFNETDNTLADEVHGLPFVSSSIVADALLSLCYINARPAMIEDPATGKQVQAKGDHPCTNLLESCYSWLQWALLKEDIRIESEMDVLSGVDGGCYASISACAITAMYSLAILKQTTTDRSFLSANKGQESNDLHRNIVEDSIKSQFYMDMFDSIPRRSDVTRAAAATGYLSVCCAADRIAKLKPEAVGLLTGLQFLLDRMLDNSTSPSLKQTLALLMLDVCTGRLCAQQRVGIMCRNDFVYGATKLFDGPLGACYGGDNGSAIHTSVSDHAMPAANAVNDGARRGLKLMKVAGQSNDLSEKTVVQVARFATSLWRTINGELGGRKLAHHSMSTTPITGMVDGICAFDGQLRCSLLALWQCIWPKGCPVAVLRVQSWKEHEGTQRYKDLGADQVMKITDEERRVALDEDKFGADIRKVMQYETNRQAWRMDMAKESYQVSKKKESSTSKDPSNSSQGLLNQPLPTVEYDKAWKHGGWIASAANQRRAKGTDGGSAVTVKKIRLTVQKGTD